MVVHTLNGHLIQFLSIYGNIFNFEVTKVCIDRNVICSLILVSANGKFDYRPAVFKLSLCGLVQVKYKEKNREPLK